MEIIQQALYEHLFLLSESDVDCLINFKLKDFDPVESICYSSFLNMICQTTPVEELLNLQICGIGRLFEKKHMLNLYLNPKIIYHRDNLLHYIGRIISNKIDGENRITGKDVGSNPNIWKYGEALLLINNKINFLGYQNYERELIKSFPYHFPKTLFWLYKQRIIRYSYIYKGILPKSIKQKDTLQAGIKLIEEKYSIKLDDYIDTIKGLFVWFLAVKETGLGSPHFDMNNPRTFYIDTDKFKGTAVFPTVAALSKDIDGFYEEFKKERRDKIDNDLFCYMQAIFDYPVFKSSDTEYCIIDFKFLVDGICSGLFWKIDSIVKNENKKKYSIQKIKEEYGYLLEEYFAFLIERIFSAVDVTRNQDGKPDAVLTVNDDKKEYIVIFEFTTKAYRISSLYNKTSKDFVDDLNRILFSDKSSDKGKFLNLDKYVSDYKKEGCVIIPILVTESWIGDYDLLNKIDNILSKNLQKHNLSNLLMLKPIILSLDDLETFWAVGTEGRESSEFIELLKTWEKVQKGNYWYNFASFVSDDKSATNKKHLDFFRISNLTK
ncbi:MAG: hypothetical protein HZB61_01435 [Nitrospirae bacterium]|nr:hypothetical protein [Nitrospirota bacterium]